MRKTYQYARYESLPDDEKIVIDVRDAVRGKETEEEAKEAIVAALPPSVEIVEIKVQRGDPLHFYVILYHTAIARTPIICRR